VDLAIDQRTALVTGGAGGIGAQVSRRLGLNVAGWQLPTISIESERKSCPGYYRQGWHRCCHEVGSCPRGID